MMRSAAAVTLSCVLAAAPRAAAQQPAPQPLSIPSNWVQGFSRGVSGEIIAYPWSYPGQTRALLTRAVDGTRRIEWEGEAPAPGPDDELVTWLWHGGLASGYGAHRFTLSVNGRTCASFTSGRDVNDRAWRREGENGCSLAFQTTRVGTFNELFGVMMLTAPRRLVGAGPPRFVVVGEAAGSQDYYMTFEERVASWTRVRAEQARFRDGRRTVRLDMSHIGSPAPFIVRSGSQTLATGMMSLGHNFVLLQVESGITTLPLTVEIAGRQVSSDTLALAPVRAWEIRLLPHSHVDIGYSDPQPVVEEKQWKNLREAVALAAKTAGNPPDARFRWNVEGLWSVESYLKQAGPDERRAFIDAVRQGAIGLQANYTNILTGICTPEELSRWTDAARRLQTDYDLPLGRTAMHTDIPGLSWTVVSALARAGVRYFSSGPNYMPSLPDLGDRIGLALHELGDRPFWWTSPSGQERVLFWMAGRGYSLFHGMNSGPMETTGRQTLLDYVWRLNEDAYPYDLVQVRYTIGGDNGPVDPALPDFVKTWNETFETPRLVIDTSDAMFAEFERRYGATLPARAGDMTPYWEDGAISTAAEESLVRAAVRRLQQAEALWAMRLPRGFPAQAFDEAWRQALLWHEHTWGAADSISQPDRKDVVDQWLYKQKFALEADRQSRALLGEAAPGSVPVSSVDGLRSAPSSPAAGPVFEVANTLSWPRDGLVVLPADATAGRDRVLDDRGRAVPSQRLPDGRLAVQVTSVPALGATRITAIQGTAASPAAPVTAGPAWLDNGRVRVVIDPGTGDISSLTTTARPGMNFATAADGLNGYRFVPGRDPATAARPGRPVIDVPVRGPLLTTVRIVSDAPGASRLVRTVTLTAGADDVELESVIEKTMNREKESTHLAFPVNVPGGAIRVDQGEAIVTIGKDQLPGSCNDFIGVQSAVDVSNDVAGISIASLDAPLVEIGALTDERQAGGLPRAWRKQAAPGTTLYAYLLNNYWHTNYKADQQGRLVFRFVLRPHGPFDAPGLRRFSAAAEQPLLAFAASPSEPLPRAPFRLDNPAVVVSSLKPAGDGTALLVRLYNSSAADAAVRLVGAGTASRLRLFRADASGRAGAPIDALLRLPPFGTVVVRVE